MLRLQIRVDEGAGSGAEDGIARREMTMQSLPVTRAYRAMLDHRRNFAVSPGADEDRPAPLTIDEGWASTKGVEPPEQPPCRLGGQGVGRGEGHATHALGNQDRRRPRVKGETLRHRDTCRQRALHRRDLTFQLCTLLVHLDEECRYWLLLKKNCPRLGRPNHL